MGKFFSDAEIRAYQNEIERLKSHLADAEELIQKKLKEPGIASEQKPVAWKDTCVTTDEQRSLRRSC
jgi:hypothetical protein